MASRVLPGWREQCRWMEQAVWTDERPVLMREGPQSPPRKKLPRKEWLKNLGKKLRRRPFPRCLRRGHQRMWFR